jgi:hypothetical protein
MEMEKQQFDRAYHDRIAAAVIEAIFKTVICQASDGSRVAVLMSGEIIDALVSIQASVLATAPSAQSTQELHRFCDARSKKLFPANQGRTATPRATIFVHGCSLGRPGALRSEIRAGLPPLQHVWAV